MRKLYQLCYQRFIALLINSKDGGQPFGSTYFNEVTLSIELSGST